MSLRIDQIVDQVRLALDAFAQGLNGKVSIARDPYNIFEILSASPAGYLLILHWAGDQNINEVEIIPLLRHRLEVIIGTNLGLTAKPDLALLKQVGNRPALYQSIDDLRNTLLGLRFADPSTGGFLEYAGTEPVVTPDGVPLAAFKLTFGFRAVPASPSNQIPL